MSLQSLRPNLVSGMAEKLRDSDVAIDFSSAEAVRRNIEVCLLTRIPLVEGTTGWNEQLDSVGELVRRKVEP